MIWFTSDFHFGHKNIIEFGNRPYADVEHMNHELVSNYNKFVTDEDTCYILGDFAFANSKTIRDIVKSMKGKKILIQGNHDRGNMSKYGFDYVYDELLLTYEKFKFRLSHYPYAAGDMGSEVYKPKYLDRRPPNKGGEVLFHGHSHSSPDNVLKQANGNYQLDIGVDGHKWRPWAITEIIKYLKKAGVIL